MRSLWKGLSISNRINRFYDRKIKLTRGFNHRRLFISDRILNLRRATIISKLVGLTFQVRNGKEYAKCIVDNNMIGYKFGSYISTKRYSTYKAKKKKK